MSTINKETFTVVLRDKTFTMSLSQIEFEPKSLFAKCLLGGFQEGQDRRMVLDRNPASFQIILDHLTGYPVLPLDEMDWKDSGMSEQKMLRYLKADAEYYGLDGLNQAISTLSVGPDPSVPSQTMIGNPGQSSSANLSHPVIKFIWEELVSARPGRTTGFWLSWKEMAWAVIGKACEETVLSIETLNEALKVVRLAVVDLKA